MRETFYLRLGETPESDCEFGTAGADPRALRAQRGSFEQATERSGFTGRRVVVFLPATDVRLALVKVPVRQPSKVLQAVPYALEDQVAEDVDSLHFAIGTRLEDGQHPVAIVSRSRLARVLGLLRARGLQPDLLVPETLALPMPTAEGAWSAMADGEQVVVRSGGWSGFACAASDLVGYLDIADPERAHPLRLQVAGEATVDWSRLGWPVTLLPQPSAVTALAASLKPEQSINLLQGAYAQSRDIERLWKPWRLAAALLLAWLAVSGGAYVLQSAKLAAELRRQDDANIARFQQLFPDQTRVVDLSAQLDQQLRALGAGGDEARALTWTRRVTGDPGRFDGGVWLFRLPDAAPVG